VFNKIVRISLSPSVAFSLVSSRIANHVLPSSKRISVPTRESSHRLKIQYPDAGLHTAFSACRNILWRSLQRCTNQ